LGLLDDLAGDADLGQSVGIGGDRRTIDDEDRGQRHGGAGLALDLLDLDVVPFGDLVLLAAGLDDRVHGGLPLASRVCARPCGHTVCAVFLLALRLTSARIAGPEPSTDPVHDSSRGDITPRRATCQGYGPAAQLVKPTMPPGPGLTVSVALG